jgi:hypothetical protein
MSLKAAVANSGSLSDSVFIKKLELTVIFRQPDPEPALKRGVFMIDSGKGGLDCQTGKQLVPVTEAQGYYNVSPKHSVIFVSAKDPEGEVLMDTI